MSDIQSLRQDYICKVRYQNDLPPPPCPPKLLRYTTFDPKSSLSDSGILSNLFRKENFKNLLPLDKDLGMPLNLLLTPGLIEQNDENLLMGRKNGFQLHPDDLLLMIDPQYANTVKSQPVSFLRRTQYIAQRSQQQQQQQQQQLPSASLASSAHSIIERKRLLEEETNALAQVRAVELTFEKAQELEECDLLEISHPTKKKLKAKKLWNFLPDVSLIDKNFISLKFNGSASISRHLSQSEQLPEYFQTSIFRPVNTEQGEEWVSLFTTSNATSATVKKTMDDTSENIPIDNTSILDESSTKYEFNRVRDYDMIFKRFENEKELAINFDSNSNTAFFAPINGKIDLKRRRITPALATIVKENTVDRIELSIREPTTSEAIKRDNARSRYDPINYIEHEEELDELDEEDKLEKEDVSEDSKTDEVTSE